MQTNPAQNKADRTAQTLGLRKGQVALQIPGSPPIILRFGIRAMRSIKERYGLPFMDVVQKIKPEGEGAMPDLDIIVDLFMAAAAEDNPTLTEEAAEILISDAGFGETLAALTEAIEKIFTKDPEAVDGEEPPEVSAPEDQASEQAETSGQEEAAPGDA